MSITSICCNQCDDFADQIDSGNRPTIKIDSSPIISTIQQNIFSSQNQTNTVVSSPVNAQQLSLTNYHQLCQTTEVNLCEVEQLRVGFLDLATMRQKLASLKTKNEPTSDDMAQVQKFHKSLVARLTCDNGQIETVASNAVNSFIADLTALIHRDMGCAHKIYKSVCSKDFTFMRPNLLSIVPRVEASTKQSLPTLVALLAYKKVTSWNSALLVNKYATFQVLLNSVPISREAATQYAVPTGDVVLFDDQFPSYSYRTDKMFIPPSTPMPGSNLLDFVYMHTQDGDALVTPSYLEGIHILSYLKDKAPSLKLPTYLYTLYGENVAALYKTISTLPLCLIGSKAPHSIEKHRVAKERLKNAALTGAAFAVIGAKAYVDSREEMK